MQAKSNIVIPQTNAYIHFLQGQDVSLHGQTNGVPGGLYFIHAFLPQASCSFFLATALQEGSVNSGENE